MSGQIGVLMPNLIVECVPGDKFHIACESLLRLAPLLSPVMGLLNFYQHYWFVPDRLVWENWPKFIVADASQPAHPYLLISGPETAEQKKFLDYCSIPPNDSGVDLKVNAIPMACIQKIYDEWYRDQNLITSDWAPLADGANPVADYCKLRLRAFEHDYFTASLPWAQKSAAVEIPLGIVELEQGFSGIPHFRDPAGATYAGAVAENAGGIEVGGQAGLGYDPDGSLIVGATTLNDFRRAEAIQTWLEALARGGSRYVESIESLFGVRSPDARLQRPEYIGGAKSPIVISEVLNSTGPMEIATADDPNGRAMGSPQGDMAGHAVSVMNGNVANYFCQEHGYIIGICSVLPKTAYYQGVPRWALKNDYLQYYFPNFAHIGEQEVYNSEIFAYTNSDHGVFGYLPRYSEYKYMPSRVAGDFRTTLEFWQTGRKFATLPTLSQEFVECNYTDFNRIFAVEGDDDHLWMHLYHSIKAIRPMPVFGTPSI